jgi:autotransporter adhesin
LGSRDRGGGGRRGAAGAEASATARRGMARGDDGERLPVAVGVLPWQQQQQQQPTVSVSPPNSKAYPLPYI